MFDWIYCNEIRPFIHFLFLASCATPHVVDIVQPNDEQLSCIGLQNEIDKLDKFREEAGSEKGVTWGNTGRLIFPIAMGQLMKMQNKQLMRQIKESYILKA